jgi:putative spermidine/putrescine transport system ATP-binding protein
VFIESLGKTVIAYAPAGLAGAERTPGQSVAWGFRAADVMEFATA